MAMTAGELSQESFAFKEVAWKIPNFLDLPRRRNVTSPEFRLSNATWCLILCSAVDDTGYIYVWLVRSQSPVPEHLVHHKIGLKTVGGGEYESCSGESTFHGDDSERLIYYNLRSKIVDERRLLLPYEALTFFCQIRVSEETTLEGTSRPQRHQNDPSQIELQEAPSQIEVPMWSLTQTEVEKASSSVRKLQSDYSKLLKSEEDSDVCLKVSDKEFRAHRCILRARSAVFSAMFKHDTEEEASGDVVIEDLDPESFPDFLQHVYAGRVEGLSDENVFNLYLAADKYDLQELKSECRQYMKRNLSVDTFCDVMIVAVRHEEEELLKIAVDYFSANIAEIVVTVKWQRFLTVHPTEANELLIKAFVPRGKK